MTDTDHPARPAYCSISRTPCRPVLDLSDWRGSALFTFVQPRPNLLGRVDVAAERSRRKWRFELNMQAKKRKNKRSADSFNPQVFLDTSGVSRKVVEFRRGESIFSQGEPAETVMYVQKGGVKFSVVNGSGKEAVIAMFGPTDFFGEGCLAGQTVRMGTTTAVTPTTLLVIRKEELLRVLHLEHELSDHFIGYMLAHNIRVEEDLIDQLFNSSEKRLARTLLLLARYGKQEQPDRTLPKVSQETLANMAGTTRSRVNFFMNKFRKLGFIEYNGKIKINKSLLTVVLQE